MSRSRMLLLLLAACTSPAPEAPEETFWRRVAELCGSAYAGRVIEVPAGDTTFAGRELIMHVRECGDSVIRIPFHVGDDRSRT